MFYGENIKHESHQDQVLRERAPYVYIHGQLEDELGYDCCDATIDEIPYLMKEGVRITEVVMLDGVKKAALLFTGFRYHRMQGLICGIDDLEAVKYCTKEFPSRSMFNSDSDFLQQNHNATYQLIFNTKR